jgi:hypothetical protein
MKDKTILVIITILFLITGALLLFSTLNEYSFGGDDVCIFRDVEYRKGDTMDGYLYGNFCTCGSGGLVDCVPEFLAEKAKNENEDFEGLSTDSSELESEGLAYEYLYVIGALDEDSLPRSSAEFESVAFREEGLVVVLKELQYCPRPNVPPEQVGFFKKDENSLTLYNMVRQIDKGSGVDCIVQLKYIFEKMDDLDLSKVDISFVNERGIATSPSFCFYNDKVYFDSDVFQGIEGEICVCRDGEVDCK